MRPSEKRFLELVRDNEARIRRISRVYGRDPEDASDLYQEILVQLWRSLPSFRGESELATWLYRVALNTGLGHRRKRRARPDESGAVEPHDLVARSARPDRALEEKERIDRLHTAIGRLGDIDKALVTLYLDDRSYREMAEVMGISETNVGVKLHRIRRRLAAWIKEDVK